MALLLLLVAIFVRDVKNVLAIAFVLSAISIAAWSSRTGDIGRIALLTVASAAFIVCVGRALRFAFLWIREWRRKKAFKPAR